MMNNVALKFAASTLILGVATIGCTPAANMYRPVALSAKAAKAEKGAAKLFAQAEEAMRRQDFAEALTHIENGVALSPSDVGYRMLLADLYLKNGRFLSAETTFSDVLTLNPGNARAEMNLALVQIALGKNYAATSRLDRLAETAEAGDVGLAFALAGQPQRAIEMLEPAARAAGADARVRQNLALSYALAGDWQKARTTAAQDVAPGELHERIRQWAAFAQPQASWTQVASLLGVTPVEDLGQPTRLALTPVAPAETTAFAAAEIEQPVEAETPPVAVASEALEPVAVASASPAPVVTASAPIAPVETAYAPVAPVVLVEVESVPAPLYAETVRTLVEAPAAIIRASAPVAAPIQAFVSARKVPRIAGASETKAIREAKASRFVVQIGAYRSPEQVEQAWAKAYKRYPLAGERTPLSTTVVIPGKGTFHRLSVSGFGTPGEAARVCGSIRAKGGACFVRTNAGDIPVRWATRYSRDG